MLILPIKILNLSICSISSDSHNIYWWLRLHCSLWQDQGRSSEFAIVSLKIVASCSVHIVELIDFLLELFLLLFKLLCVFHPLSLHLSSLFYFFHDFLMSFFCLCYLCLCLLYLLAHSFDEVLDVCIGLECLINLFVSILELPLF